MQRLQAVEEERRETQERPLRLIEKLKLSYFLSTDNQTFAIKLPPKKKIAALTSSFAIVINNLALRLLKPPQV